MPSKAQYANVTAAREASLPNLRLLHQGKARRR